MSNIFSVVTDSAKIVELNNILAEQLAKTFDEMESRVIAYPAGYFRADVYFESGHSEVGRAWASPISEDKLFNFLLSGSRGSTSNLEISVQLNFPNGKYSRKLAGAFVKDSNGEYFIAHRGRLTKGRASLKQEAVLTEFASRVIEAVDDKRTSKLILISSLYAVDLARRLWDFAIEARIVATKLGEERDDITHSPVNTNKGKQAEVKKGRKTKLIILRSYFDEFSGESDVKGYTGGRRTIEHGDIVKALEATIARNGQTQKAQAIDLALISKDSVAIYEVKTSARTTDVYTGVGQLLIHGESLSELLHLPVLRYLVLPENPNQEHAKHILRRCEFNIVVYKKSKNGYVFEGL